MFRFLPITLLPFVLLLVALPHRSAAHYHPYPTGPGTAPHYPYPTGTGTAPVHSGTVPPGPTGTGTGVGTGTGTGTGTALPTGTYGYAYAGYARDIRIVRVRRGDGLGWE